MIKAVRNPLISLCAILAMCALAGLLFTAVPARAAITHPLMGSFGPDGTAGTTYPTSPFPVINSLAFDQASERLHALRSGKPQDESEICRFGAFDEGEAAPLPCFSGIYLNLGNANLATIAVDNSGNEDTANNVYVGDNGEGSVPPPSIRGFLPDGTQLTGDFPLEGEGNTKNLFFDPVGVAIDSRGHLWVGDASRERIVELEVSCAKAPECTVTQTGRSPLDTSSNGDPFRLAFDSRDNLYVAYDDPVGVVSFKAGPEIFKYTAESNYTEVVPIDEGNEDPVTAIAVDGPRDHLFAVHFTEGEGHEIVEYDVSGSATDCRDEVEAGPNPCLVSRFGKGNSESLTNAPAGIAVDEDEDAEETKIYLSNRKVGQIEVFGTVITEPGVVSLAATERTVTGATANGTVNPKGKALSDCHFAYVAEAAWAKSGFSDLSSGGVAPCVGVVPPDESKHSVSAVLSGLDPATRYRYRLSATSSEGTGTDGGQPFATLGPLVSATKATGVTYSEALLLAKVNPQGKSTTYHFEYVRAATCLADEEEFGPEHCFDHATSTNESKPIGSDEAEHSVSAVLTGLQAGTPYRLRAVATNEDATGVGETASSKTFTPQGVDSCPNAADREGPSELLPECRAYEQVSPLAKGSADAAYANAQAAATGSSLTFPAEFVQSFPGGFGSFSLNPILAQRNVDPADGSWGGKPLGTAFSPAGFGEVKYGYLGFASDLSKMAFCTHASIGIPGDGDGLYLRDNATDTFEEVAETNSGGPASTCELGNIAEGEGFLASPDYEEVYFQTKERLCGAPNLKGVPILYGWADGACSIVSRDKADKPIGGMVYPYRDNAVSVDGTKVFWGGGSKEELSVYARIEGKESVEVSESERNPVDPAGPRRKAFIAASSTGDKVFFTSGEKLTDDSTATPIEGAFGAETGQGFRDAEPVTGELYRYDFNAPAGERLIDISIAPEAPNGAQVQGVLGASADGNRIYYVALAALVEGAVQGLPNLYLWDNTGSEAKTTHIATLAQSSQVDRDNVQSNQGLAETPMTNPSGDRLVFASTQKGLVPYDNANRAQIYLYDASEDTLTCVSCDPSGEAASASAALGPGRISGKDLVTHQPRNLSIDGNRIFFESGDSLLPSDTNGRIDVYEWHEDDKGEHLVLLSSGQSSSDSHFVDASATGDDVFFTTRERLSPLDNDSQVDVYDARVGGKAAKPVPPSADCLGEACQPAAVVPNDPTPASSGFRGLGNANPVTRARCPKGKRKVRRAGKVRCVRKRPKRQRKRGKTSQSKPVKSRG